MPDRDIFRSFSIGALSEKVKKFKLKNKKSIFPHVWLIFFLVDHSAQ